MAQAVPDHTEKFARPTESTWRPTSKTPIDALPLPPPTASESGESIDCHTRTANHGRIQITGFTTFTGFTAFSCGSSA